MGKFDFQRSGSSGPAFYSQISGAAPPGAEANLVKKGNDGGFDL